jgi:hypothetical protein
MILDLQMLPMSQLQCIPGEHMASFSTRHRTDRHCVNGKTPQPVVEGRRRAAWIPLEPHPDAMHLPRPALWEHLDVQIFERGTAALVESSSKIRMRYMFGCIFLPRFRLHGALTMADARVRLLLWTKPR